MNSGIERRYGEKKCDWFSRSAGRTLLVAVGTGLDFPHFPPGHALIGIDISQKMLEKAGEKLDENMSNTRLVRADVQVLGFANNSFDSVVTSCTFCSVPDPVLGLKELRRVIKPGGKLLMFEHVRSDIFWMGPMMDLLTCLSRRFGPDLNRRTGENIVKAGFKLTREVNIYLDMVKLFEGVKTA
ncbi:MAG: class I SAM-dependent methyltransferase [Deltaproteobacteria bacterium]|nr:class I SAM-dependent methyltransferase [Deltaproteobacteria bacterium]